MEAPKEIPLAGGYVTPGVVHVGATVRRPAGPHSPFVHEHLRYLEEIGFDAAPRFLGIDEHGREMLTFIESDIEAILDLDRGGLARRAREPRAGRAPAGGTDLPSDGAMDG